MAYTVAITNQKGGVGKTTTAVNLAAALAIAERRTLLVDADPQGNTTSGVGIAKVELQLSLYDALVEDHPVQDIILPVPGLPYLSLLPATQDLVGAELQLVERPFREAALRRVLEPLEGNYDYIIVDCPPSLGLLTLNVLAAVQALIIPIQCEYYGLEGISQLLNTVRLVQQNINPGLAIGGVLLTMYDSRLNLCRQVAEDATEYFGPKVFGTPIPRNVRLAEAPSFGKPILLYDMQSVGAKSYLAVGQELLRRVEGDNAAVMPTRGAVARDGAAAESSAVEAEERDAADSAATEMAAAEHVRADGVDADPSTAPTGDPETDDSPTDDARIEREITGGETVSGESDGDVTGGETRNGDTSSTQAANVDASTADQQTVVAADTSGAPGATDTPPHLSEAEDVRPPAATVSTEPQRDAVASDESLPGVTT
jgi:chromosome partitioning protein